VSRETPTIRRWQLGQQMRQLREAAGITVRAAAKEIESSNATMSKIESGKQAARPLYVKLLATMYGVEPAVRQSLIELAGEANQSEWFASLAKHIPDWFKLYLGYEGAASERRVYSVELIDGLLQTPEYARAIARANRPDASDEDLDSSISVRQGRQGRLTSDDPLTLHAIINEAALRRVIGSPKIMRDQLEHVVKLSKLPNVTVQILPFSAGAHPAMTAPFVLLGFDDHPGMNTVYLENGRGALYLEGKADLTRYGWIFGELCKLALNPVKSRTLLATVVKTL
jgi:transcriptional regulator with XRE-family HTH domain